MIFFLITIKIKVSHIANPLAFVKKRKVILTNQRGDMNLIVDSFKFFFDLDYHNLDDHHTRPSIVTLSWRSSLLRTSSG